jgi:hypothetical protein
MRTNAHGQSYGSVDLHEIKQQHRKGAGQILSRAFSCFMWTKCLMFFADGRSMGRNQRFEIESQYEMAKRYC